MRIYNATYHKQNAADFAKFGFTIVNPEPTLTEEIPTTASFEDIQKIAEEVVAKASLSSAIGILIGGMSSLAIALYNAADAKHLLVCEAATERVRDENDRFVFRLSGVRIIL